jgi:hypothetical protein
MRDGGGDIASFIVFRLRPPPAWRHLPGVRPSNPHRPNFLPEVPCGEALEPPVPPSAIGGVPRLEMGG